MSNPTTPPPNEASRRRSPQPTPSPATPPTDWVMLGQVTAPFGLRGAVKLQPATDFPDRVGEHTTLYLGPDHRPMRLLEARPHGTAILLTFADINDMTAAETLRGLVVTIPQEERAPLAPDQYFVNDLIGLRAMHVNGTDLGRIVDVQTNTAQDLLVIRRPARPDVLVPLVKALVPQVDIPHGTVTIDPPAGLFDDDFVEA